MNEHDTETARFIAEKVMGYIAKPYPEMYNLGVWLTKSGKQLHFFSGYNPRQNVAQAIEAAEKFGLFDDAHTIMGKTKSGQWMISRIGLDGDEYILSIADTLAATICDALEQAIKTEEGK